MLLVLVGGSDLLGSLVGFSQKVNYLVVDLSPEVLLCLRVALSSKLCEVGQGSGFGRLG